MTKKGKSKKPTNPYGWLIFSKDGKVTKEMFELSHDKETQEVQAIEKFIELYNQQFEDKIDNFKQLDERGHDFEIFIKGKRNIVQLTELFDREYKFPISEEDYNYKDFDIISPKDENDQHWAYDVKKMGNSLKKVIANKISKNYSPEPNLWLIVFSTDPLISPNMNDFGLENNSFLNAKKYIQNEENIIFSKIWFTGMIGRVILIHENKK